MYIYMCVYICVYFCVCLSPSKVSRSHTLRSLLMQSDFYTNEELITRLTEKVPSGLRCMCFPRST